MINMLLLFQYQLEHCSKNDFLKQLQLSKQRYNIYEIGKTDITAFETIEKIVATTKIPFEDIWVDESYPKLPILYHSILNKYVDERKTGNGKEKVIFNLNLLHKYIYEYNSESIKILNYCKSIK